MVGLEVAPAEDEAAFEVAGTGAEARLPLCEAH